MMVKRKEILKRFFIYVALIILVTVVLFPMFWLLRISLEPCTQTVGADTFRWVSPNSTLDNFRILFKKGFQGVLFPIYIRNSFIVAVLTVMITIPIAALGGYSFSRFEFRGKNLILILFLITQMISTVGLLIPLYLLLRNLHLLDTYFALVITYTSFSMPFCTWFIKGFFDSIPISLEESALIDGCTHLRALLNITIPLSAPGIIATSVFSFITAWNEFIFANTFMFTTSMKTFPVGLAALLAERFISWGPIAAGGVLGGIPVLILFGFFQKWLVKGLTAGAVKE